MNNLEIRTIDKVKSSDKIATVGNPDLFNEIGQAICALLNSGGGSVYIGIDEAGEVRSRNITDNYHKVLNQAIYQSGTPYKPALIPQAYFSCEIVEYKGIKIAEVNVPAGLFAPYSYQNIVFVRKNKKTIQAGPAEINHIINKRYIQSTRWGTMPALEISLENLDINEILKTSSLAVEKRMYAFRDSKDPFMVLEDLNLIFQGQITNYALILYGKQPERIYPHIRTRIITYYGKKTDLQIGEDKFIEGNLLDQYELIFSYLSNKIPVIAELSSFKETRTDTPKYPYWSLREGIRNALIHRNYSSMSAELKIEVFNDRISIWSYGKLPDDLEIKDLKKEHPSLPTNPEIAQVFFLNGIIEKMGRGTQRIIEEFSSWGLNSPKWEEIGGGIKLTMTGKTIGKIPETLNQRQIDLIRQLKTEESITVEQYLENLNMMVSPRTARYDLAELTRLGYLKKQGKGQSTIYIKTDKN